VENLMKKLHKLCLAIKTLRTSVNKNVLKTTYSAYFHSTLKYGILFWENLKNLTKIFKLRKKLIRLIASVSSTTSCKQYFKELKIMTLPSIKIYEILVHIKMSLNRFKTNSLTHSYYTMNRFICYRSRH
jgi:hypothetical protein